jgi:hypothetical protein
VSGSIDITIEGGADWGMQFTWADAGGDPIPFSDPIMHMRTSINNTSQLIARLDESGQFDGKLTIVSPGVLQARMSGTTTASLRTGYGFWDIFVDYYDSRVRLAFGTVAIAPHVTDLS